MFVYNQCSCQDAATSLTMLAESRLTVCPPRPNEPSACGFKSVAPSLLRSMRRMPETSLRGRGPLPLRVQREPPLAGRLLRGDLGPELLALGVAAGEDQHVQAGVLG